MTRHIPTDLGELVVKLAIVRGYQHKKIRPITGVSARSIKRVKVLYLQTEGVYKGMEIMRRYTEGTQRGGRLGVTWEWIE